MLYQSIILVLACSTFTLGFSVDRRDKREIIKAIGDVDTVDIDSLESESQSANDGTDVSGIANEIANDIIDKINNGIDDLRDGPGLTHGSWLQGPAALAPFTQSAGLTAQQTQSVNAALQSMQQLGHQKIQTGATVAQAGLSLSSLVPGLGR